MKIIITESQYNFLSEQTMGKLGAKSPNENSMIDKCESELINMGFSRTESNSPDTRCYSLVFQGNFEDRNGPSKKQFTFGVCIEPRFGGSISVTPTGRQISPKIYDYEGKVDSDYVKNEINFIYRERSGAKAYKANRYYVYDFPLANCDDENMKIGVIKFLKTIISKFKSEFPQYI